MTAPAPLDIRPPIPLHLEGRDTVGGLVIPWLNVRLADGGVDFRNHHTSRAVACWTRRLCQICSERIDGRIVLVGGPKELDDWTFHEPPMHPACAAYATKACPMLAGRMSHYGTGPSLSEGPRGEKCTDPACDCGKGWQPSHPDAPRMNGQPAHPWFLVWADRYDLVATSDGQLYGGRLIGGPLKVRQISTPAVAA